MTLRTVRRRTVLVVLGVWALAGAALGVAYWRSDNGRHRRRQLG
jgi:hypothetical protein